MDDRLAKLRSFVKRPAVQEHIAAAAALAAREAERRGVLLDRVGRRRDAGLNLVRLGRTAIRIHDLRTR